MAGNEVDIDVKAKDSTSSTVSGISKNVESSMTKAGGAVVKFGQQIGGELGEIVSKAGESFEGMGAKAQSGFGKISAASAGLAGVGIALQTFASGSQRAEGQLKASVEATGASFEDYGKQIDAASSKMARFGHDDVDTADALRILTQSTNDTGAALKDLQLVADLAAAKHESLSSAAQQVALIYAGNTRLLKQYGITLHVTAGNTDEVNAALTALSAKLDGQAAASVDNFSGKVNEVKTRVIDWAARMAGDVGPALTYVSGVASVSSGVLDLLAARHARAAAAAGAQTVANAEEAASATAAAAANTENAISNDAVAAASTRAGVSALSATAKVAGIVGGVVALGIALEPVANKIGGWVDSNNLAFSSLNGLTQAENAFTASLEANQGAMDQSTRADVVKMLQSDGLARALDRSGISLNDLTNAVVGNDAQFAQTIKTWQQAGKITDDQAFALLALKNTLNDSISTAQAYTGAVNNISGAAINTTAGLQRLQGEINSFNASIRNVTPTQAPEAGSGLSYAHGGAVGGAATGGNRNGAITWAEHGDEMAKLPNGSYVYSNPDTQRMMDDQRGGGQVHVVIEGGSGSTLDALVLEFIRKNVRVLGGGNVQTAFGR